MTFPHLGFGGLRGKTVLVAGATRGTGRGVALSLGEAGATVYVAGRTARNGPRPIDNAPGSIEETAAEVTRRGGKGIAVQVDFTDTEQVNNFRAQIGSGDALLDLAVCSVWRGNERFGDARWERSFWEYPTDIWDECMNTGPLAFWLMARVAASIMAPRRTGLIVAISEPTHGESAPGNARDALLEIGHYAINRLVRVLAEDCQESGISILGVLPGFVKTERVEAHLPDEESKKQYRYDLAESAEFSGRAIVSLATDPGVLTRSGTLLYVGDLAEEYGFTDIDGTVPNFYRMLGRHD